MKKRVGLWCVALLCIVTSLAMFACKKGKDEQTTPPSGTPQISITNKITSIEVGDSHTFTVSRTDLEGEALWQSSAENLLTVDGNGKITAIAAGSVTVTVTVGEYSDRVTITVTNDARPVLYTNEEDAVGIYEGLTYRLHPTIDFRGNEVTDAVFSFASSDENVATVSDDGVVTGVKEGNCTVHVQSEYRGYPLQGEYAIRVKESTFVSLSKSEITLYALSAGAHSVSEQITCRVMVKGEEKDASQVTWSVTEGNNVVSVANGLITAQNAGKATVRASYDNNGTPLYAECAVNVLRHDYGDTGLTFDYVMTQTFALPTFRPNGMLEADFATDNIEAVYENNTDVFSFAAKTLDKDKCYGEKEAKTLRVVTGKAEYTVSVRVYNAKIENATQLNALTDCLGVYSVDGANTVYTGYVEIVQDIDMQNTALTPMHFSAGIIEGNGHTISRLHNTTDSSVWFRQLDDGAVVRNLTFTEYEGTQRRTAAVCDMMGKATLENITVIGSLPAISIDNVNYARGLVVTRIGNSGAKFINVTAVCNTTLSAATHPLTTVFGHAQTNYAVSGMFTDCRVFGSNIILGWYDRYPSENIAEFKWLTKHDGILLASFDVADYETLSNGNWVFNSEKSTEATCTEDGVNVFEKGGEETRIVLPKTGHEWGAPDAQGHIRCALCNAQKTVTETAEETDVRGFDFASLHANAHVEYVFYNGADVTSLLSGSVLSFAATDASLTPKVYNVFFDDDTVIDVSLTVWSLLIANETDLRSMNDYLADNGMWSTNRVGYFKLTENIALTDNWTDTDALGSGCAIGTNYGFRGVFDGNGKTISDFTPSRSNTDATGVYHGLIRCVGKDAVIKNLTVSGGYTTAWQFGGLVAAATCGGTFENITVEATAMPNGTAGGTLYAAGILLGEIGGSNNYWASTGNITVKNVTVINKSGVTDANGSAALGFVRHTTCKMDANDEDSVYYKKAQTMIACENVVLVGFDSQFSYNEDGVLHKIATQEQANSFFASGGITVYATVAEYESAQA